MTRRPVLPPPVSPLPAPSRGVRPSQVARWLLRVALASVLATGVAGLAIGTPAWAHSRLQHTDPADGSVLTAPRSTVTLTFNERVRGTFTTVVVTGPGNLSYSDGHVQVIDDDVHQRVYPLHSGGYAVAWRAISADGHPVEGQFHFTVTLPAGEEPTAMPPRTTSAAAPGTGSGTGWWVWVVVGVAVLALAGGGLFWSRRHGSGGS